MDMDMFACLFGQSSIKSCKSMIFLIFFINYKNNNISNTSSKSNSNNVYETFALSQNNYWKKSNEEQLYICMSVCLYFVLLGLFLKHFCKSLSTNQIWTSKFLLFFFIFVP